MRKILYISGTRADYGLMRETLFAINKCSGLKLDIAATGMHLMDEFGRSVEDIEKDAFDIHKIEAVCKKDNKESMANFIGEFIQLLTERVKTIKPNIILLLGDRAEMLAGAIVGTYLSIPVAHIHGGDVSSTVDEHTRHAITKLAHLHFTATRKSKERILKMGEEPWRVFITGAPGLDSILKEKLFSRKKIERMYNLKLSKPILLVIQHPVTKKFNEAGMQMRETMEAIKEMGYQTIVIYPNTDAGGRRMIKVLECYRKLPFIRIYKNISHGEYLSLMQIASVMIGNSSSGIIEAPSFCLPVVNIGIRQKGRERAGNIIDVDHRKGQIKKAVKKALYDKMFRKNLKKCKNPYGDGKAGVRIANILSKIKINDKLLQKRISY